MTHKPKPTTRTEATARMNLMVPGGVCARVIRQAQAEGCSVNEPVCRLLASTTNTKHTDHP